MAKADSTDTDQALALELGLAWQAAEAALPPDRARYSVGLASMSAHRYYAGALDKFTQQRVTAEADTAMGALRALADKLATGWEQAAGKPRFRGARARATHPLRE